jgi:DNA-binding NarL/FixJ family response regulator
MTDQTSIRILAADDHPLLREGIASVIKSQPDMLLVAEASSGREAIRLFREERPDVTLMDLRLPDLSGIDTIIAIRAEFSEARIVLLSTFGGDAEIQSALRAGAWGYMLKSMPPPELVEAIRKVHAGKRTLPPALAVRLAEHLSDEALTLRELQVLEHVAGGNRNRDIGQRIRISEGAVKRHMKSIMQKLGADNRTKAIVIAARRGILRL